MSASNGVFVSFFTKDPAIDRLLLLSYCLYMALIAVITLDTFFTTGNSEKQTSFWLPWLLQVVPLLLLFPGMLQKHYRSFSWVCFLMLAYFTSYVVQVYSSASLIDWLGLILVVTLFVISMYCSRLLQRLVKGINT